MSPRRAQEDPIQPDRIGRTADRSGDQQNAQHREAAPPLLRTRSTTYDYAGQDPVNSYDLQGTCKKHRGGWFHRFLCASLDDVAGAAEDNAVAALESSLSRVAPAVDLVTNGDATRYGKKALGFAAKHVEQLDYVGAAAFCVEGAGFAFEMTGNPYAE